MHALDPRYVCPSRKKIAREIDSQREDMEKQMTELSPHEEFKDVFSDIKSASLTSDGGKGKDKMKTKKNTLTIHYITNDFHLKTDTLAVAPTKGKQDAKLLMSEWKKGLGNYELIMVGKTENPSMLFV